MSHDTALPILPGIKRGAAFKATLAYAIDGVPDDFPVSQLKAQVRTASGALVAELTIEDTATPGQVLIKSLDTSAWPLGELLLDVKRTASGEVTVTQTVRLPVSKRVTD